jgi:hypothetical protein
MNRHCLACLLCCVVCAEDIARDHPDLYRVWREEPERFCLDGRYPVLDAFRQSRRAWTGEQRVAAVCLVGCACRWAQHWTRKGAACMHNAQHARAGVQRLHTSAGCVRKVQLVCTRRSAEGWRPLRPADTSSACCAHDHTTYCAHTERCRRVLLVHLCGCIAAPVVHLCADVLCTW